MLAGATLAGCARFQPEPLAPAVNATALDSRTLDDPRLQTFLLAGMPAGADTARLPAWDLGRLTLAALYYQPDITVAGARVEVAALPPAPWQDQIRGYGTVIDLAQLTDLSNAYAGARAQQQTMQARLNASRTALAGAYPVPRPAECLARPVPGGRGDLPGGTRLPPRRRIRRCGRWLRRHCRASGR